MAPHSPAIMLLLSMIYLNLTVLCLFEIDSPLTVILPSILHPFLHISTLCIYDFITFNIALMPPASPKDFLTISPIVLRYQFQRIHAIMLIKYEFLITLSFYHRLYIFKYSNTPIHVVKIIPQFLENVVNI